jgi:hypothetical protein
VAKKSKDELVQEVVHPANDDSVDAAEFADEQNRALMHYRLTGEAGVYIDPTRDQEPDIAPELGVAPHPELANPAPPKSSFSGRALNPDTNPMVLPAEEKEELAADATEAFNEVMQAREEAFKAGALTAASGPTPLPVVVVDEQKEVGPGLPSVPVDESVKARESSGDQVNQDLEAAGAVDSDDDSDDSDTK